jgi:D-beta-D-heptose 7-phosphate kinase/D-beta-D-heptose 1-phosphate adenosyltransferase
MTDSSEGKIVNVGRLLRTVADLRRQRQRIVFTNGCFDLIHAGHVHYLAMAKSHGDILVVGLNSDASVRRIKDRGRPILSQDHRARVLVGLRSVDFVTVFDEPDPGGLIERLKPDVLVKGADWADADIVGRNCVLASGGRVVRVAVVPGLSTTAIIDRILVRYRAVDTSTESGTSADNKDRGARRRPPRPATGPGT